MMSFRNRLSEYQSGVKTESKTNLLKRPKTALGRKPSRAVALNDEEKAAIRAAIQPKGKATLCEVYTACGSCEARIKRLCLEAKFIRYAAPPRPGRVTMVELV